MSDTTPPEQSTQRSAVAMPIQITAQYVKDLSFENPRAPASLRPQTMQPRIDVNVDVQATPVAKDEPLYEVVLKITANATAGEDPLFVAELTYAGLFGTEGVPEDALHALLLIECPRLLFPFARSIIADATRDGGFPPLLIQPVDFAAMYRQGAAAEAGEPAS